MSHVFDIYFVATSQEEVGAGGATVAAYSIDPDLAVALDVTHATLPSSRPDSTVPLDTAALSCGPYLHHKLVERIRKTAQEHGIRLNMEACSQRTWTDADSIQIMRSGIPCALIDLPLKYMHTSVELLDMNVMRDCGRLLAHFLSELDEGWEKDLWI